jgi:hypothetical protein
MCRPPQCPSPFPRATVNADQEPWDYERFLETCNGFATARGSWYYEADGRTAEELRERYHRSPREFPDIRTFAEGLFIWDQGLNL